jgi:hypothetical protein
MTGCTHPAPIPHAVCYAFTTPEGGFAYSVHVAVFCPACQMKFRFVGLAPSAPEDVFDGMLKQAPPWTTPDGDELGALVTPDVLPGENLFAMQTLGSA